MAKPSSGPLEGDAPTAPQAEAPAPPRAEAAPSAVASGPLFASGRQAATFWGLLAAGMLLWCVLLFGTTDFPAAPYFDEIYNAGAAQEYVEGREVREQTHPPLYKLMEAASLWWYVPPGERAFSVDLGTLAHAIRQPSVVTSAGALFGLALLGLVLYGPWAGLFAAFLLACDPFFVLFGRTAMNYSFSLCFCLNAMACFALALRFGQRRWLWACGLAFGLAFATRWSAVFTFGAALILLFLTLLRPAWKPAGWKGFDLRSPGDWAHGALALGLFPPLIYVAAYAVPVANQLGGYGHLLSWDYLSTWWEFQQGAYRIHSGHQVDHSSATKWYQWPFQPRSSVFNFQMLYHLNAISAVIGVGNPLMWGSAPFALLLATATGLARRQLVLLIGTLPALILWLTWARHVDRLGFNHYFLEAMPYALLSVVGLSLAWWRSNGTPRGLRLGLAGGLAALNLAFVIHMWPLSTGQVITVDQYVARMWRPEWDAITQIKALEARKPLSRHELHEQDEAEKRSLRSYLMGRKSNKQKARTHDDRGTGLRVRR